MRALQPAQLAALSAAFAPTPIVTAYRASEPADAYVLPLIAGELLSTAASTERSTLTCSLPMTDTDGTRWAPARWSDLLVPSDCVLRVDYGIGFGPLLRLATLWLDDVSTLRPDGVLELTAYSRATRVAQAGFPTGDRRYTGSTAAVIEQIVEDALGVQVVVDDRGIGGPAVASGTTFDGSPWDAVEQLCDAAGGEAYFGPDDQLILRPTPDPNAAPVATLTVGEGGTITSYRSSVTRAPNVVRMAFQDPNGTAADVIGTATATGPADPRSHYGTYREDVQRSGVVTQAQADQAAAEYLKRAGGLMRTVELECVPHPALEVGDVIAVGFVDGALETHRIVELTLPLTPGETMRVGTKAIPW